MNRYRIAAFKPKPNGCEQLAARSIQFCDGYFRYFVASWYGSGQLVVSSATRTGAQGRKRAKAAREGLAIRQIAMLSIPERPRQPRRRQGGAGA